ncbi:uncharacterized protein FOMMEDRAFT_25395 [Fomitiporia mediterranea MF3/22]|uniref:uncharacterized protein n=1 Tax=Fomitiporia mediterranea (strain MF3/22) TaxID=694068 RepID=UPI000440943A|nr:uncharacterized protein FOMMEDRAFT_25395 [Fomitiporia mediterranea MF3/22]EJD08260.1 hypothetical protein FOMMEDRAFT_25395 [Fomitiporia mediterranea MF3/22]
MHKEEALYIQQKEQQQLEEELVQRDKEEGQWRREDHARNEEYALQARLSTSTSPDSDQDEPLEDDHYPHDCGSPSPTSSEDSATPPTPLNSALPRVSHGYTNSPAMGNSSSAPEFLSSLESSSGRERVAGRSRTLPVATLVSSRREPEADISSVTDMQFGGPFNSAIAGIDGVEEGGDVVMSLEYENRQAWQRGVQYEHTPGISVGHDSVLHTSAAAKKDLQTIGECKNSKGEERGKDGFWRHILSRVLGRTYGSRDLEMHVL